jgi:RNA polymerase sigma-70 factor (ECF subfamily)
MTSTGPSPRPSPEAWFATTHWSVVLAARAGDSLRAAEALETLCRTYWYPLYTFVRRQGQNPQDAEDLVQEFFARLLQKNFLKAVNPERGRFRTFLSMAMKRFMANEWDRQQARKRGGGQIPLPLDTTLAERRYQDGAAVEMSADLAFDRQWAITLLEAALSRIGQEQERLGKGPEFHVLKQFLTVGKEAIPYHKIAVQLRVSDAAVRMAAHRLRRRFREIFREEITQTVANATDVDEEIRHLLRVLGS